MVNMLNRRSLGLKNIGPAFKSGESTLVHKEVIYVMKTSEDLFYNNILAVLAIVLHNKQQDSYKYTCLYILFCKFKLKLIQCNVLMIPF